ncbi:MAG: hypothetical protein HY710_05880 [Candidatus Latescibacteria bacterium]|nr:hypothetical protein [Candidatus Latescibacterota bacterium]
MPKVELRQMNGAPTVHVDGRPVFLSSAWSGAQWDEAQPWPALENAAVFARAGVPGYAFDQPRDLMWVGPGHGDSWHDFTTIGRVFRAIIAKNPSVGFLCRIHLQTPQWWQEMHHDECELWHDGHRDVESYASEVWRRDAADHLHAFVEYVRSQDFGEHVWGYHICVGGAGEWVKESAMRNVCADYSPPMQRHFQAWVRKKYDGDRMALRDAWRDPGLEFYTVAVPAPAEFNAFHLGEFRDPLLGQKVVDYFECLADLCADDIGHLSRTVKEACQYESLVGIFYGYLTELAWASGFFGGPELKTTALARSGHLALAKVLSIPTLDYLCSPYSYGWRQAGGDGTFMPVTESIRAHGKIYLSEDDTRPHAYVLDPPDNNYGQTTSLQETLAVYRRNMANILCRNAGVWWCDHGQTVTWNVPEQQRDLARYVELGTFNLSLDRRPSAEIAVIVDEHAPFYTRFENTLYWPLVFKQRQWGLSRIGAPYDSYLLSDVGHGLLDRYKLFIFLNAFVLDDAQREAVAREVRRDGKTAVWLYAAGLINRTWSAENLTDLTGLRLGIDMPEWGLHAAVFNFRHPITRDLPANTQWGTDGHIGPIIFCDDPDADHLAHLMYTRGRCKAGMATRDFGTWKSVWVGAPNVPSHLLRGIARWAGVHIFSESDDVVSASRDWVSLHTVKPGPKRIVLPRRASQVWEAFSNRLVGTDLAEIQETFDAPDTRLYYYGTAPWPWG